MDGYGGARSWQPSPRTHDTGYGERMTSHNNSYSSPKSPNFTDRPPWREEFKVYIKNIPADMSKESVEALFRSCGTVMSTQVLDPKEGRNSTIGFVRFASEEEVTNAIERMNGTMLGDNHLVVEKAVQRDRGGAPHRNHETEYQRRDFQNTTGNQNERPPFQGYRTHNQQAVNGSEMTNHHSAMGVRQEEAIFNPRGPGRGGMIPNDEPTFQQAFSGGHLGQQNYRQSAELSNQHQPMGVRHEEAVFNPKGPGRGGGTVNQFTPSYAPAGRTNGYMNAGMSNGYSNFQEQRSATSWMNEGQQQWVHTTRSPDDLQQEMNVTGRLPHAASSENTAQIPYGGEVGHFAREHPNQDHRTGKGGQNCYQCNEVGHFARECPNQEENGGRGPEGKMAPVTYIPPELPSNIDELFQDAPHSGLNFDKYDAIPVNVTGKEIPPAISTFEEAGILEQCALNIQKAQFTKPTPIQKYAIPITLAGRDLMACAQTGSGKTVAYLLPVLTGMIKQGHLSGGYLTGETQYPAALCLAPTRELAMQIHKEVCKFSNGTVVTGAVCYGGVSVQHQLEKIKRGCHFLIATPGRLLDFVNRKRVSLESVRYLILDEADRMLDMGFENDVRKIVETYGMPDKTQRQTLMFSATFPDEIQRLAADFLKDNYLFVAVGTIGGSNLDISQTVITVPGDDKQEKLFDILLNSGTDRTLIFVELKRVADFLACLLSQNKFPTTSISGDRTQQEREAALRDFRSGRAPVLVATSVAARGLDIPDVKHVINYDLPQDIEEYVHRIGRTGRIGNKGKATSFFQPGKDERLARSLVKVLSQAYQEVPEWLEQVAEEAVGSSYGPAGGRFASRDRRERDHPRASAHDQPRTSGHTDAMSAVTRGMERVSVQAPSQYLSHPRNVSSNQDEEDWD